MSRTCPLPFSRGLSVPPAKPHNALPIRALWLGSSSADPMFWTASAFSDASYACVFSFLVFAYALHCPYTLAKLVAQRQQDSQSSTFAGKHPRILRCHRLSILRHHCSRLATSGCHRAGHTLMAALPMLAATLTATTVWPARLVNLQPE